MLGHWSFASGTAKAADWVTHSYCYGKGLKLFPAAGFLEWGMSGWYKNINLKQICPIVEQVKHTVLTTASDVMLTEAFRSSRLKKMECLDSPTVAMHFLASDFKLKLCPGCWGLCVSASLFLKVYILWHWEREMAVGQMVFKFDTWGCYLPLSPTVSYQQAILSYFIYVLYLFLFKC